MEDPLSIRGNTVHWFIPTIYDDKIINGLNTYKKYGWYGPCPPRNTGKHKYIFTLYMVHQRPQVVRNMTYVCVYNMFMVCTCFGQKFHLAQQR